MSNIKVQIEPFTKDGLTHDTVSLSLSYDKNATGPVLTLQAVDTSEGSFRFSIFGSPRDRVTWDAGWKTNNAKKMAQALQEISRDIENRSGRAWEAVKDFVKKHGMVIVEDAGVLAAV
jgi:hypothetical protein